jgi:APA family basic amino acid/polyamine antiporter
MKGKTGMPDPGTAVPRPNLSVLDGVAIMVGIVVGIGIFKTPALVAANVGGEFAFIGVWLLGGVVTLIGALCYAELASGYPHAGGEYHFLSRALGRPVAVMFGWARGTVIQTGAIALVAFVFGDYMAALVPLGPHGPAIYAAVAVAALTGLNLIGTPQSKRVQIAFTILTIATLLVVVAAGFLTAGDGPAPAAPERSGAGALGMAMILVLLTYGGWSEAAYLSAETRNPGCNMVRVLLIGTLVLVALYTLVNAALLSAFGLDGLRASNAVAADLMHRVAGEAGGVVLGLIVVAAALSTLNATIFTGARVYYALGRDLRLAPLGRWNGKRGNPARGIMLQGVIALGLIGLGAATRDGFQSMVDYTAPVFWSFLFLVGISLFVLRRREPDRHLPFRVPLYPLIPTLFCATCLYMLYSSIAYTGIGALVGIAVVAAGLPLLLRSGTGSAVPEPAE